MDLSIQVISGDVEPTAPHDVSASGGAGASSGTSSSSGGGSGMLLGAGGADESPTAGLAARQEDKEPCGEAVEMKMNCAHTESTLEVKLSACFSILSFIIRN